MKRTSNLHNNNELSSTNHPGSSFSGNNTTSSAEIVDLFSEDNLYVTSPRELLWISKEQFTQTLDQIVNVGKQRDQQQVNKYTPQYDKLVALRRQKWREIPQLAIILDNMKLWDSARMEDASTLILQEFGGTAGVMEVYADKSRVEQWKQTILELHNISVEKNLGPFELGEQENSPLISQGMKKVRDFYNCNPTEARAIYERLADYGYLGTTEEIARIKNVLDDLEDAIEGNDNSTVHILGWFIASVVAILAVAMISVDKALENINLVKLGIRISAVMIFLLTHFLVSWFADGFEGEAKWPYVYPYRKTRQLLLRSKLKKLENRDELIRSAVSLLQQTSGVKEEYNDIDSIKDTKEIKKLVDRLWMIARLMQCEFDGGKKFDFAYLNQFDEDDLSFMNDQIKPLEKAMVEEKVKKILDTLLQGEFDKEHIAQIEIEVRQKIKESQLIHIPEDAIVIEHPINEFQYIQGLDELVSTYDITEPQKVEYEAIKDEVVMRKQPVEQLRKYVEQLHDEKSNYIDHYEVEEKVEQEFDALDLDESKKKYLMKQIRIYSPTRWKDKWLPLTEGNGKDNIPLDLNALKAVVEKRKQERVSISLKANNYQNKA